MEEVDNGCPMIRMGVSASEVTALWHCTICLLLLLLMYRPTQVVPDKGPLNGCVCVCVSLRENWWNGRHQEMHGMFLFLSEVTN